MNRYEKKNSSFIAQAAILASALLFSRLIGFIYKLFMYPMLGDAGMGVYNQGYAIYGFLLVVSSAGLPAAISRMVSARLALNQNGNAQKVLKVSLIFAASIGLVTSLFMFFGARFICDLVNNEYAYYPVRTLAPTVFIVGVMSVLRGYFQGTGDMFPTALSQIIEQIVNAIFSVLLVYIYYKTSIVFAASGGTAATGIGAVAGIAVLMWVYTANRVNVHSGIGKTRFYNFEESSVSILKELVFISFPIIAGTAIFSFANIIDTSMLTSRLQAGGIFTSDEQILSFTGQLGQKFNTITTLPVSIVTGMGVASIPGLSAAMAKVANHGPALKKDMEAVTNKINLSVRLAMIISIPAAFGIGIFGDQIIKLLYPAAPEGGLLLRVGFISVVFLALSQICTGVLQGIGMERIPVVSAFLGLILKVVLNYYLIPIPELNVLGAVIGTIGCYAVAGPLNMYFAYRFVGARPDFMGTFIKPLASSLVMSMVCFITYYIVYYIIPSNLAALSIAIFFGICVYFFVMTLIGGIKYEDYLSLPMGKKLLKLLGKIGVTPKN